MPPSFKGADGKIAYTLEARLGRSLRIDKKDETELTFVPRVDWSQEPELRVGVEPHTGATPQWKMSTLGPQIVLDTFWIFILFNLLFLGFFKEPQHDSKDKKMKLFNSGSVSMDVSLEKTGFFQGGALKLAFALLVSQ